MNFNANASPRQPFGRKIKRVSDVNAMGYNPYSPQQPFPNGPEMNSQAGFPPAPMQDFTNQGMMHGNYNPNSVSDMQQSQQQQQQQQPQQPFNASTYGYAPENVGMTSMFAQPMVQNMAMQYTQQLASTGTTMVKQEIERYVPVTKLKYYFAVNAKYVISKLGLLFFPFTHTDWSIKFEQDGPVQPRFEINAPDLYIPSMAFVTYLLVAGIMLGMQNRFTPEQIGIQSSSALAWCLVELAVYSCTLYIANIQTSLRTLDLLAYSGYKFVGIIVSILLSVLAGNTAYYIALCYSSGALAFFLIRALRAQVLPDTTQQTSYYGEATSFGNKRRLYFLLLVAGAQPVLSWWLSFHLLKSTGTPPTTL